MKTPLLAFALLFSSSCSTFSDAFKTAHVHEKMVKDLDGIPYEMSSGDLQKKVIEYMTSLNLNGKWVYTSNPGGNDQQRMQKVQELVDEGFTYKEKLYVTAWTPDMSLFSGDMEKIKSSIMKSSYHILESSDEGFLMVKGNSVYEAKKMASNKMLLKVYKITQVVTPLAVSLDWWKLIKGKGFWPSFGTEPVDLNLSRKYQEEDKVQKLSLFFFIDKVKAEKMEAEMLAASAS